MLLCTSSVSVINVNDGIKGDQGVSISSQKEQWYLSDSSSKLTGGSWSYTEPTTIPDGKYLWGRWENTMSDGSKQHSAAVYRSTIQGLKNITDSVNNSITQKVWESDITNAIDDYDGTTAQSIRDDVSQLTTDLSGITTRVGKTETTLATKADGSTVTTLQNDYSAFKQTMNGFKITVESSYATIEDLNGIKVSGNNLYHIRDEVPGYIGTSGGISSPSSTNKEKTSAYIPVVPGAAYIIQSWVTPNTAGSSWLAYQFYADESADDKIGNRVDKYGSNSGSGVEITAEGQEHLTYKVVAPENAKYLRVSYRHFEDGCCMVEQATIPSEYAIAPVDIEHDTDAKVSSVRTIAEQTADKFTWLVKDGTSASNFTLTSRVAELISPQVVIKDPAGSATIITGGKIQANSITTNMLKSDAIKSTNYTASSNVSSPYSATGAFLDLNTGSLYMPNFGVNGTTGAAYFNGTVNANAGKFGDDTSYWNIETVYDYNMQPHAALVGTGSPYLQTGNWQVSDNAVATRKYTSTSESAGNATYYKDSGTNTFYDVGMKIPTNFGGYSASDSSVTRYNKAFYYGRKYTGNSVPSLDSDWTYFFEIDSGGNIITAGDVYEGGVKLSEKYAAITDVGSAYLPKTGGTITGNLTVNGNFTTNLMIQTNLASTSAAQLTGNANATVTHGVTGTLGVAHGGTGQTTANAAANAFITALPNWTATPTDDTYFIRRDTAGSATYGQVKFSTLWTYINNKISSTYDITNTYRRLDDNQFDTIDVTDIEAGNLIVTGAGRFTNGLYGNLIGNADTATTATTANKVANSLQILLNSGSTEGTNKFTYDGSSPKNINITKSSIGLGSVENTALSTWAGSSNLTTTKVGTLAAAATKGVDTSISVGSTSTNLPTSKAVAAFVSANNGVTSITLTAGGGISLNSSDAITSTGTRTITNTGVRSISESTTNGKISVNTGGTTADVAIHGLGSWAYKSSATASDVGLNAGQLVKSLASNNDGKLVLTYFDDTTSDPIEVKIVGQSGSSVSYADALNVNGSSIGGSEQPVYINNQGKPTTTNKIPKLNNTTTGGAFYAPTSVGTSSQILKSNGSGAPTWINQSSIAAGTAAKLTSGTVGSWSVPVYFSDGVPTSITYLNSHPENNTSVLLPFINNDLAYLVQRGGSYEIYSTTSTSFTAININKTALSLDLSAAFDGSYSYCSINRPQNETTVIDIVYPGIFDYTNRFYIDFGSDGWGAKNIQLLVYNSNTETSYVLKNSITDNNLGHWTCRMSHTSTNSSGATVQGFNRLRIVLSGWVSTQNRIAQIGVIKYNSIGTRIPYMSRGIDDQVYRSITPAKNNTYSLGSSTNNWSNVYATTFYGALSGNASSATKATQDGDGAVISSTYLKRSGGTITGQLKINGADIILGATGTGAAPNDSGDLVWQYGNGTEKMRLYSSDTYTEKHGIAFRQYDENQNQLYSGKIPLADGTDATGTWGISITGSAASATKATQDSDGKAINTTYAKLSGATFTGAVTGTSFAASSYLAANYGNNGADGGLALWGTVPTDYGIAMRTTANGGKHGYVQGDYGIYSYMAGSNNTNKLTRGWILKNVTDKVGVASVSGAGHAVFNGSVTVGGNAANTSGMRMEYDATLQCTNFVFN